jgi:hypothetical protein
MKALHMLILASVFAAGSASLASAHQSTPRVDRRQATQQTRIHDGVRRGELTAGERARLRASQRHLRRLERRAISDGAFTRHERRHLERAQDLQSRRIARMKHNRRSI